MPLAQETSERRTYCDMRSHTAFRSLGHFEIKFTRTPSLVRGDSIAPCNYRQHSMSRSLSGEVNVLPFLVKWCRWTGATDERDSVVVHLRAQEPLSVRFPGAFTFMISPVTRVWSDVVEPAEYLAVLRRMFATKVPRGTLCPACTSVASSSGQVLDS